MHSSTLIPQLAPSSDHDTTNGFSLLTSLRQHFTALRQQDADVHASQAHGNPDHSWTPYWVGPCDLRQNSQTDALGSYTFKLPDSQRMIIQPAKHTKKSRKSLVFLNHNKVRHHKQRQHHKQHQRQEKHQDNVLHNLHSASHQLAGGPQNGQHHQLEAAYCSAQQEKVSLRAAATPASAQALQLHQVQNACKAHIGHSSSVLTRNQHTPLPEVHNAKLASRKTAVPETYTTQATADGSHVGCIRALPRVVWQDVLKTTDSIPATHDLCLKHFRGRPNANPFQIACDLSKAGQRRTQNLHAAVRASLQLMHRFVVRRSAIAHMGVFTTGYLAAGELVMEYAGEVIRRPVADKREQQYTQRGLGLYFFALDKDYHIDATYKGNIARYINHSCRPNCVAKLVDVQGQHRVFIFATQQIAPLEELTYDYKVSGSESLHDASTKVQSIPCNCNSFLCRGSL